MPRVRFELVIPASERAKTVHALDRSTNVTSGVYITIAKILLTRTYSESIETKF
jgi:hypothetical protein